MNYGKMFGRCTALSLAAGFGLASGMANAEAPGPNVSMNPLGFDCIASECVNLEAGGYSIDGGAVLDPSDDKAGAYLTPGSDSSDPSVTTSFNVTSQLDDPEGAADPITVDGGFDTGTGDVEGDIRGNVFELYWGSVDAFNEITFFAGDLGSKTFDGQQLFDMVDPAENAPDWDGISGSNFNFDQYVRFTGNFDSVELNSSEGVAFEVATAADVPQPGMLGLMGLGLVALGAASMRRRNS